MTREELDEPLRDQIIALIEKARDQDNTASELADAILARFQQDREAVPETSAGNIRAKALEEAAAVADKSAFYWNWKNADRYWTATSIASGIRLLISWASATQSGKEGV